MSLFTDIEALVIEQTRRPEIPAITRAAIRTATLRAHHVDFFPRDLASHSFTYIPTDVTYYEFQNISSSMARLRALKHIQSVDSYVGTPTEQLEYREQDDLFDSDGVRREHIYTLLGDTLRIYPTSATGTATVYYYQNPDVADASYSSWIASTYPDEISAWAAGIVFARTGFAEMAQDFNRNHIVPFKDLLISSHLLGNVV